MTPTEIRTALDLHQKWLAGDTAGVRAYLTGADLSRANLSGADLSMANLTRANLTRVNLSGANLTGAYLWGANLTRAYLTRANLTGADLTGANLTGADLSGADLTGADLSVAKGCNTTGITLLTVHLSPYSLTYRSDTDSIHIGCRLLTVAEWLGVAGKEVADEEGFTPGQYKKYMVAIRALRRLSQCK